MKLISTTFALMLMASGIVFAADKHDHASHETGHAEKMSAAKTDEERQTLMTEQQKLMQGKQRQMMSMHSQNHGMSGMPSNMAERQQMMQKHKGLMGGQMPMGAMSH